MLPPTMVVCAGTAVPVEAKLLTRGGLERPGAFGLLLTVGAKILSARALRLRTILLRPRPLQPALILRIVGPGPVLRLQQRQTHRLSDLHSLTQSLSLCANELTPLGADLFVRSDGLLKRDTVLLLSWVNLVLEEGYVLQALRIATETDQTIRVHQELKVPDELVRPEVILRFNGCGSEGEPFCDLYTDWN